MKKIITYIFVLLIATSCKFSVLGFIAPTSDTVNKRFEQSQSWNTDHGYASISVPNDEYKFYVTADIHTEETTINITKFVTDLRCDSNAYLGLIIGDLVNQKGAMHTLMPALKFDSVTQQRNDTLFATVGNHDLYFDQWNDFKTYWHTSVYWFEVKCPTCKDLFIMLDTGNGTLGNKQLQWLRDVLAQRRNQYRHCIVGTHTNLFKPDDSEFPTSNMPIEETYEITSLMSSYNVDLYLQGHDHYREIQEYRGVTYTIVDALRDSHNEEFYLVCNIGEKIDYDFAKLK